MAEVVAIVGGGPALGDRVRELTRADPGAEVRTVADIDRGDAGLAGALRGADVVVHLGAGLDLGPEGLPSAVDPLDDVRCTRLLLEVATEMAVERVVMVSSAMVYGAWPDNPVPLTEEAPLRPDPGLVHAAARAEMERLVLEWRDERDARSVAVLRPTVSVDAGSTAWLASSPWSASALVASGSGRPSQFLHLDDLASAVEHVRRQRLVGPFNVSPDGWLPPDALAELAGPAGRLHLPPGLRRALLNLRADVGTTGPPPGWSYSHHPWVVANDRLESTGWSPGYRNEEVYVEADPGGPLTLLSARRRQALVSAGLGAVVLTGLVGAVLAIRRRRTT